MTTYTDAGDGFDVAIGGLPFKLDVSKDRPYERATAQFRKEQFDSAPTVGDQSLSGWWTRGQLSFHKGAGVTYYEVLDGETVLDRCKDSDSANLFTPGAVALIPSLSDLSVAAKDAVPAPLSGGGGLYALTGTGVKYTTGAVGSTPTSIATSDAAIPTSITSSGSLYYVTNGTKIEKQYEANLARTNHVTNPSFETDATGWTFTSGGGSGTMDIYSDRAKYGTKSLGSSHSNSNTDHTFTHVLTGLSIGQTYVASCWVYNVPEAGGDVYTTAFKVDSTTIGTTSAAGAWTRLSGTFVATATSHTLTIKNGPSVGGAASLSGIRVDSVMFTEAPYTGDYFDGSQPGCAWTGTPNASKSTYATSSGNASTVLITLTGGATWVKAWWAKGRIWAVDSAGYWYALAATVATVSNTAAFWNSGKTGVTWSLGEGTGPVYISDGYDVYSVTVGTDGVVPTISTPTTVTRMPLGEQIAALGYYLGYLIIPTTRGVRVAVTDGAQVLLGGLVIKGDFTTANRVGVYDTKVYVAGRPDGRNGDNVLCVLDLGNMVTELLPAWSPLATISTLASTASGAMVDATGKLFTWAAATLLAASRDELASTGYVTTGFHRFGTLEPKHYETVLVRASGTAGTIGVSRVDADGTVTALTTITLPITSAQNIDLGLTSPVEMIGLKFTLNRSSTDATKGPTLLGYQLKALPAPQRQRMIRLPLMLMDIERRGGAPAVGYEGSAWDRLSALETMEAAGATYTFQDFRTGETGEVFIESVEHRGEVPPGDRSNGFGGIVWLTLRKLA